MAKCKNCTKCLMGEAVFIYGTRVYPFCGVDGEEVENLDEDKECIDFECMTNADRIRSMTDEELAEFMDDITPESQCHVCAFKKGWLCEKPFDKTCHDGIMKWLKSEVGCE